MHTRLGRALTWGMIAILGSSFLPAVALAQADSDPEELGIVDTGEYESPQFGTEVTWTDDWEPLLDGATLTDPDIEIDQLGLTSDVGNYSAILVASNGGDAASYLDILIDFREEEMADDDFERIDQEVEGDAAWYTYSAMDPEQDRRYVVVGEITEDGDLLVVSEVIAWPDVLTDAFDLAQETIEIEGEPPFAVHFTTRNLPEVEEEPATEDEDDAPAEEDEEAPPADDEEAEDSDAPANEDDDAAADDDAETPANEDDEDETPSSDEAGDVPGLIDDTTWQSPQFDTEVTWTDDWELVPAATYSDTEGSVDNLRLATPDGDIVQITPVDLQDESLTDWIDRQMEFRENGSDTAEIEMLDEGRLGERRYVAYLWTDTSDVTWYVYREFIPVDDDPAILVAVEFFAAEADPQDLFDQMQETIEIDGDAPFAQDAPLEELGS